MRLMLFLGLIHLSIWMLPPLLWWNPEAIIKFILKFPQTIFNALLSFLYVDSIFTLEFFLDFSLFLCYLQSFLSSRLTLKYSSHCFFFSVFVLGNVKRLAHLHQSNCSICITNGSYTTTMMGLL